MIMIKPTLDSHTIKVLNEQGIARKEGEKYITTSNQGNYGELVFTFSKERPSHTLNVFYRLHIVLNSRAGNCIKIHHCMGNDEVKVLYDYISKRTEEIEQYHTLVLVRELNVQKADVQCTIK